MGVVSMKGPDILKTCALPFRRYGNKITEQQFVYHISFNLRLASPSKVRKLLYIAIKEKEIIREENGFLIPVFQPHILRIPFNYAPEFDIDKNTPEYYST